MDNPLWICWTIPPALPEKAKILSFLSPSQEEEGIRKYGADHVISGRKIAQSVKDDALYMYTTVVARIGAERVFKGKSLRELLKDRNGLSQWWYHPVSFKDCEADPTFNRIIQILAIDRVVSQGNIKEIILWHADDIIAKALKTKYRTVCKKVKRTSSVGLYAKAFGSRIKHFAEHVYHWYLIKWAAVEAPFVPTILLQGFWDWSVRPSEHGESLDDRYFKSLPELLKQRRIKAAWLLWLDPHSEPGLKHRSAKQVLKNAQRYRNLIFLQKYLTLLDIVTTFFNYRLAFKYFFIMMSFRFRDLFKHNGFNLFPLFKHQLSYHFMSSTLPHYVLVEKACEGAFVKIRPKCALSFLEMFPYSRAFYAGARKGCPDTRLVTMQHASYSREKTYIRLDPAIELDGKPDNCPMPKPDHVFAMGELGKEMFQECGFAVEDIFLTGSARYEHVRIDTIVKSRRTAPNTCNLLMVTTLDRDLEMDMVEAVFFAAKDLPQVKLYLRNHPFARMDEHPLFQPLSERITITSGTLDEDLRDADLLLFSYSTVAEEAFIRGTPVWQWNSANHNGSVFRDIRIIPAFCSVSDLRHSIEKFLHDPQSFLPEEAARKDVLRKCFYKGDGKSAERIAGKLIDLAIE